MFDIYIHNCNNIDYGKISIVENTINVKYAINGTGKSTIANAISYKILDNKAGLKSLTSYKNIDIKDDSLIPHVEGLENIHSIKIFNEEYINQYVFQQDELIQDSFSIFVKTPEYEQNIQEIELMLKEINDSFQSHPELEQLIEKFSVFVDGFGKAKSGYSLSGSLAKGLGKGNKIDNVPAELEDYKPFLQNKEGAQNVKWIKWQLDGKNYLDISDKCPYCTTTTKETKGKILKVSEIYDAKTVEHLDKILEVFEFLKPFFDTRTVKQIEEIEKNATGITKAQQDYLVEIKEQICRFLEQLKALKFISFNSIKRIDDMLKALNEFVINLELYSHLNSDLTKEKVKEINASIMKVIDKAKELQIKVNIQNNNIKKTIQENETCINGFLKVAGYKYIVSVEENENKYRLLLKPIDNNLVVQNVKSHLSYGEKNALALILFMFDALKENPELIILDDPISSFDGNKKFALIYTLFLSGKKCLKQKTILLLTHDFNTVLDVMYNLPRKFSSIPNAFFLTTKKGILSEKEVKKENIKSFKEIYLENISICQEFVNKMIYLRRLSEIENGKDIIWNYLSNFLHRRQVENIMNENDELMTTAEIGEAKRKLFEIYKIQFDYAKEVSKLHNKAYMLETYKNAHSNYEKLQIYRIINDQNSHNEVIKKIVNETFHVENDYLFQLNPCEYDTVPQFIIDECDKDLGIIQ